MTIYNLTPDVVCLLRQDGTTELIHPSGLTVGVDADTFEVEAGPFAVDVLRVLALPGLPPPAPGVLYLVERAIAREAAHLGRDDVVWARQTSDGLCVLAAYAPHGESEPLRVYDPEAADVIGCDVD